MKEYVAHVKQKDSVAVYQMLSPEIKSQWTKSDFGAYFESFYPSILEEAIELEVYLRSSEPQIIAVSNNDPCQRMALTIHENKWRFIQTASPQSYTDVDEQKEQLFLLLHSQGFFDNLELFVAKNAMLDPADYQRIESSIKTPCSRLFTLGSEDCLSSENLHFVHGGARLDLTNYELQFICRDSGWRLNKITRKQPENTSKTDA